MRISRQCVEKLAIQRCAVYSSMSSVTLQNLMPVRASGVWVMPLACMRCRCSYSTNTLSCVLRYS